MKTKEDRRCQNQRLLFGTACRKLSEQQDGSLLERLLGLLTAKVQARVCLSARPECLHDSA